MRTDNKYYGEAIREAETGRRRDDLWGKAIAKSSGDMNLCQSIYIQLLAQELAMEDGAPTSQQLIEKAKEKASTTFKSLLLASGLIIGSGALAIGGSQLISKIYFDAKYNEASQARIGQYEDLMNNLKDYLSSNGYKLANTEVQKDASLSLLDLFQKYPSEIALHISGVMNGTTNWDYYDRSSSKLGSDAEGEIAFGLFCFFLVCSITWWRWGKKQAN